MTLFTDFSNVNKNESSIIKCIYTAVFSCNRVRKVMALLNYTKLN